MLSAGCLKDVPLRPTQVPANASIGNRSTDNLSTDNLPTRNLPTRNLPTRNLPTRNLSNVLNSRENCEWSCAATGSHTLHRTGSSSLDVYEYPPGEFEWQTPANQSTCVLAGSAEVDLADGRQLVLGPGAAVYLPEGLHGRWVIKDTLRLVTVSIPL